MTRRTDTSPRDPASQLGQFIPLQYHFAMLQDTTRVEAFRQAIAHLVRPGARVLELGGGTGILSYFAAQRAERVWCVERLPELADAARRFLADNGVGERVEVVQADAIDYLPPEPVDIVICEMLHAAMLREKQLPVLHAFRQRYARRFGRLPVFLPEATLLAVQPVEQTFDFSGYHAPVPMFQSPGPVYEETISLADPVIYSTIWYDQPLPQQFAWQGTATATRPGTVNAVRLATKHVLAFLLREQRAIEWANQHLILPLDRPLVVRPGETIELSLGYEAGAELDALTRSLHAAKATQRRRQTTAA